MVRTGCRHSGPSRERRRRSTRARDLPQDRRQSPLAAPGRRWRPTDALPLSDAGSTCLTFRRFCQDPDVDRARIRSGCLPCRRQARIRPAERIRHTRAQHRERKSIPPRRSRRRTCRKRAVAGPSALPAGRIRPAEQSLRLRLKSGLFSFSSLSFPDSRPSPVVSPS